MLLLMPRILNRLSSAGNCYATAEFLALAEMLRLHQLKQTIAPFIAPDALEYYADFLKRVTQIGVPPRAYCPGYSTEECLVMIALVLLGLLVRRQASVSTCSRFVRCRVARTRHERWDWLCVR